MDAACSSQFLSCSFSIGSFSISSSVCNSAMPACMIDSLPVVVLETTTAAAAEVWSVKLLSLLLWPFQLALLICNNKTPNLENRYKSKSLQHYYCQDGLLKKLNLREREKSKNQKTANKMPRSFETRLFLWWRSGVNKQREKQQTNKRIKKLERLRVDFGGGRRRKKRATQRDRESRDHSSRTRPRSCASATKQMKKTTFPVHRATFSLSSIYTTPKVIYIFV